MSQVRFREPGFWTLTAHFASIIVLFILILPITFLRVIFAPVAEGLIRASDGLGDALSERLEL
jgi:hypothetical protein